MAALLGNSYGGRPYLAPTALSSSPVAVVFIPYPWDGMAVTRRITIVTSNAAGHFVDDRLNRRNQPFVLGLELVPLIKSGFNPHAATLVVTGLPLALVRLAATVE
ncbi:hypothetical protein MF6396_03055 [Pseudomonas sp. MF6396]|nr:hypothetical protein MF6396_03055 [Pseudomonas sp. MF6396]